MGHQREIEVPDVAFRRQGSRIELEMLTLEDLFARRATLDPPLTLHHRLGFNLIILITRGRGLHFIDFHRHSFERGSFIQVHENQVHSFVVDERVNGDALIFTDRFLSGCLAQSKAMLFKSNYFRRSYAPVFRLPGAEVDACRSLVDELRREFGRRESDEALEIIRMLFTAFLLRLERARPHEPLRQISARQAKTFSLFIDAIRAHFTRSRAAADYAAMLHTTYKTLNEACKSAAGKTAKQLIDDHVILEAKRRIAVADSPVQQLAYDLGFQACLRSRDAFWDVQVAKTHSIFDSLLVPRPSRSPMLRHIFASSELAALSAPEMTGRRVRWLPLFPLWRERTTGKQYRRASTGV